MNEAQEELTPLTAVQLLDAAVWREINSDQPQPHEAFIEALSRGLARWMLSRSQSPELETMTNSLQNSLRRCEPGQNLMNETFPEIRLVLCWLPRTPESAPVIDKQGERHV